ncbi:MAG: hypothetical protein VKJ66_04090 [Synechococcus sp.]|nr:hypothetical protein [Synechococcus sp.]
MRRSGHAVSLAHPSSEPARRQKAWEQGNPDLPTPGETPDHVLNRMVQRMMKRVVNSAVDAISANDLKTGGIGAISRALEHEREVGLSVRGELRFVVMEAGAYQRLRECELEIALQEARADLAAGRVVHESVDDHLKRLDSMAISGADELQAEQTLP